MERKKQIIFVLLALLVVPIARYDHQIAPIVAGYPFAVMTMLIYFSTAYWKQKEYGTLALVVFGLVTINIIPAMIVWGYPETLYMYLYSIVIGTAFGIHLHWMYSMRTVGNWLHKQITVEMLDKIFDPKKKDQE